MTTLLLHRQAVINYMTGNSSASYYITVLYPNPHLPGTVTLKSYPYILGVYVTGIYRNWNVIRTIRYTTSS